MADFIITGPDGKRYKVTGDTPEGAVGALKKMLGQGVSGDQSLPPKEDVVATTNDGGRVVRTAKGLTFTSPAYSTNDQAAIAKIMEGATPASQSTASFDRGTISQAPVASRAAKAIQGVPFVGEYADEAAGLMFGARAKEGIRATQEAMQRERPKESLGLQVGGGVLGSIPLASAAIASGVGKGLTVGQKAITGVGLGVVGGGVEGAVSGYGAGNDESRGKSALKRGLIGAGIGGVVGGAAPLVGEGLAYIFKQAKGTDIKAISRSFGISPDAAKVVKNAIENDDFQAAAAAIDRAGGKAMLADAGPAAQNLLDTAVQTGGKSARIAREAVDGRAAASGREMQAALDATLGAPQGQKGLTTAIREGSADARSAAYEAAYAAPIDYSGSRGLMLEGLLKRAPASAVNRANELMRLEGAQSKQILADIADNGAVTFKQMPDVRQIDYLTRALNDVADAANGQGKLGGTTDLGRAYGNLSRSVRNTLKGLVPEYGQALDTAADAISQRKAVDLGYDLLKPGTRREAISEAMTGASKAEITATKQGIRSYIDDTLANVKAAVTDPNLEIREFRKLAGDLRSRASREKLSAVLGPTEARALYDTLDENLTALELRATIAANSKTAARQSTNQMVKDVTAPGPIATLMSGKPLDATRRVIQLMTGQTPEMVALRQQGIMDEIAGALTSIRGNDARVALAIVQRAIAGQPVTEMQARLISRALGSAAATGGYQIGTKSLSTQ